MRNSSKDLSVFEFKTNEANEADGKLSKYRLLETFTSAFHHLKTPDVSDLPPIDLHEVDSPERSTSDRNLVSTEEISELDDVKECSTSYYTHAKACNSDYRTGSLLPENSLVMGASRILLASAYEDEDSLLRSSELPVNSMINEEESCTSGSEDSSTTGDLTETDDHPECLLFEHCHSTCEETDDNKNTVAVCPDFVTYRDKLFLDSHLTFCSDCIKIECSDASGSDEKLNLVCDIADIIRIGCQWSRSVDALLFNFWINTNVEHDPEKFVASVSDVLWLEKELKIKSLAERYEHIWDNLPDNNYALEDDLFRTHRSFSKRYFTEIMEPFEDVIYPKGDPDAVSISKRDIELLEPDTFINDTIIDFYIKYLQDKVQSIEKLRFHFFNCFFFRKLADLDKDPGSISEGRVAYQRVRKWTRKLNIFDKDYIFIPVNFNLHWSLLVICHPGEIITFEDDNLKNSPKVPCILHLDSLKGSHKGLEKLIQSYLLEEWKGRNSKCPDDITSRFSNLRFVRLELPQQENSSDCGLFLLHYVELFLEEAPIFFNPTKITKLSNFLSSDWFPPSEASFKRFHIRGLIYELLRASSQKLTPTSSTEDFHRFGNDAHDADQAVEFLSTHDSPSKTVNGSTSILQSTAQDDIFEQTASFKSSPAICTMLEQGDAKTETTDHLDGEVEADSAELLVSTGCPTLQIYSTSFYDISSNSEQLKEVVVDTFSTRLSDELTISNVKDETRKPTSPTVVSCDFVPDTPDTVNQQQEDYAENSQEIDASNNCKNGEDAKHVDSQVLCPATEDHCGGNENCLETYPTDFETRHEEERQKADSIETENGKAEHCPDSDQTHDEGLKIDGDDDDNMAENLHGVVGVVDTQENNVIKETSEEDPLCPGDAVTMEVIISDNDTTPPKRNKILASVPRASKRRKLEQQYIRTRVTRSSLKMRGS